MAIFHKRYYWGYKPYNTKTGLYKGETRWSTSGFTTDWKGKVTYDKPPTGRSKTDYDD